MFNYGLQHKNSAIIDKVLEQKLDFTKFGTKDSASNQKGESRTEGALLLAAKFNDYNTLVKLLHKRYNQSFATSTMLSQVNKTIGSIDRKNENNNIFHYLFKNWVTIPKEIDKRELLKKLLELLVLEKNTTLGNSKTMASIFSQRNIDGQAPLHIIFKNNNLEAYTFLWSAIENLSTSSTSKWNLAHFIDFAEEIKLEKNFLDYAYYGIKNKEILNDLFEIIRNARQDGTITAEQRNELLCSKSSPLSENEKNDVRAKLQAGGKITFLSIPKVSGKDSFEKGVKLWNQKMQEQLRTSVLRN